LLDEALNCCLDKQYIKRGDMVVLSAGSPTGISGGTNLIKVHIVGEILAYGMGIGNHPVSGPVRLILHEEDLSKIQSGDIVVTHAASAILSSYLDKIKAIIAEAGGLTSDAAIIGLNAGIPVIVGCDEATRIFKDDMLVTVDTAHGRIFNGLTKVL
jgi:pyruvate kinase